MRGVIGPWNFTYLSSVAERRPLPIRRSLSAPRSSLVVSSVRIDGNMTMQIMRRRTRSGNSLNLILPNSVRQHFFQVARSTLAALFSCMVLISIFAEASFQKDLKWRLGARIEILWLRSVGRSMGSQSSLVSMYAPPRLPSHSYLFPHCCL